MQGLISLYVKYTIHVLVIQVSDLSLLSISGTFCNCIRCLQLNEKNNSPASPMQPAEVSIVSGSGRKGRTSKVLKHYSNLITARLPFRHSAIMSDYAKKKSDSQISSIFKLPSSGNGGIFAWSSSYFIIEIISSLNFSS